MRLIVVALFFIDWASGFIRNLQLPALNCGDSKASPAKAQSDEVENNFAVLGIGEGPVFKRRDRDSSLPAANTPFQLKPGGTSAEKDGDGQCILVVHPLQTMAKELSIFLRYLRGKLAGSWRGMEPVHSTWQTWGHTKSPRRKSPRRTQHRPWEQPHSRTGGGATWMAGDGKGTSYAVPEWCSPQLPWRQSAKGKGGPGSHPWSSSQMPWKPEMGASGSVPGPKNAAT